MYNQILGNIQHQPVHAGKTEELPHRFCIVGAVISFLSLHQVSGFYILIADWFCLPLRNATPANTSSLGALCTWRMQNHLYKALLHW